MSQNGLVVLEVPGRMSFDDWAARVRNVAEVKKKLPFYIGDLLLFGEQMWGEKASQFLNEFGYSEQALENFRWLAKKYPPEDRRDLPWSWHQAAAVLPKREREKALDAALAGDINRAGIRELVAAAKMSSNGANSNGHKDLHAAATPLIDVLLLVGKLLSMEAKGEDVAARLSPALDRLVAEAIEKKAKIDEKLEREV